MTDRADTLQDLVAGRLSLVANLSALNAAALKLTQRLAGAEMEILRLEQAIAGSPEDEQLVRDLLVARLGADAIRGQQADQDDRIAAAERAIDDVDRRLGALSGAEGSGR